MTSSNAGGNRMIQKDQSQWLFVMPDEATKQSNPVIVKLRHPKSGTGAMFMFSQNDKLVHEVMQFKEEFRSWFIGDTVQHDGSIYMVTKVDTIFLMLPYLIKAAENGKFIPLEHIIADEDYSECRRLCSCQSVEHLHKVADVKGTEDFKAYRYSKDLTLSWLTAKVEQLSKGLEEKKFNISGGGQAATYVQSSVNAAKPEDYTRYAYGLMSDYLPIDLAKELKTHMKIAEPEVVHERPHIEEPNAKKPKKGEKVQPKEDYTLGTNKSNKDKQEPKQTAAQKKLSQVDKSGMKNIASFFGKPKK